MKKIFFFFFCLYTLNTHCPKSREPRCNDINHFNPLLPRNQERLLNAVNNDNIETVRELLRPGVNQDLCNNLGTSLLQMAAQNNNTEIARLLLNARANTNYQNQNGRTALHIACHNSNLELIVLLLSHPTIRPYIPDNGGRMPIYSVRGENERAIRAAFQRYDLRMAEQLAEFPEV